MKIWSKIYCTFKISINQNMVGIHFVGIEFVENRFVIVGQSVYSHAIIVFPWTHFRNTSAIWYEMAQTDQSFARNQNSRIRWAWKIIRWSNQIGFQKRNNVCYIKIHSKHSNNTLLSLLRSFMKQTLLGMYISFWIYCQIKQTYEKF